MFPLVLSLLLWLWPASSSQALAPVMDPLSLAASVNYSPACLDFAVIGLCFCGPTPCGVRVRHYVPTAFVETTGAPGDTLLVTPEGLAGIATRGLIGTTGQSSASGTDNSFESHVWNLPQTVLNLSSVGLHCLLCNQLSAEAPIQVTTVPSFEDRLCSPFSNFAETLLRFNRGLSAGGFVPALFYASELDFFNWRTGCRDLSIVNMLKSNAYTCGIAALPGASRIQRLIGTDACLGNWGPLYPRQMREVGNTQTAAAAKTAYRALSIARTQARTFPYAVDLDAKLQENYPQVSQCFRPGTLPMPASTRASRNGVYGWIYWRRVSCCVGSDSLGRCSKG